MHGGIANEANGKGKGDSTSESSGQDGGGGVVSAASAAKKEAGLAGATTTSSMMHESEARKDPNDIDVTPPTMVNLTPVSPAADAGGKERRLYSWRYSKKVSFFCILRTRS